MDTNDLIEGLKGKWDEYNSLHAKYVALSKRYEVLKNCYTHYGAVLTKPDEYRLEDADKYVTENMKYLKDDDKSELREIRKEIINVDEVAVHTIFPGKGTKKLNKKQTIAKGEKAKKDLGVDHE